MATSASAFSASTTSLAWHAVASSAAATGPPSRTNGGPLLLVPISGTLFGGLLSTGAYRLGISRFMPDDDEPREVGQVPITGAHAVGIPAATPRD